MKIRMDIFEELDGEPTVTAQVLVDKDEPEPVILGNKKSALKGLELIRQKIAHGPKR